MKPTATRIIENLLSKHKAHLKYISIHTDGSSFHAQKFRSFISKLHTLRNLRELRVFSNPGGSDVPGEARQFSSWLIKLIKSTSYLSVCWLNSTPVCDEALESLAKCSASSLQQLQILHCRRISKSGILQVAKCCANLSTIALNYSCLTSDILLALTCKDHAPIIYLQIYVLKGEDISHEINKEAWARLMDKSKNLQLVMNFHCLDNKDFVVFFNCPTPVTNLLVSQSFSKSFLYQVSQNCPMVEELRICGTCSCSEPVDKEIIAIATNCQQVKSITLSGFSISCLMLEEIACKRGPDLRYLIVEDIFIEDDLDTQERMCIQVSNFIGRPWSPVPCLSYS